MVLAVPSFSQTSSTGALSGTVTDPSGAVIVGASVAAENIGTGAERSTTTDSSGTYKLSLLPPGNYHVKFSAQGFKTAEVSPVTVSVTETAVVNHGLELGAQTERVTVEATVVTVQTENATNGGVVSSHEVTSLPLVSRNYTQIINLSPGVVANATTASAVGNGTEDVSANGSRGDQNNYSMDGSSVVNYVSGTGSQSGSFPGMAIPNPDSIQEFKVQTSQYDASSGRNPGANVTVVTKSGTNQFHGALWEFNRNNFFNANDFFYKRFQQSQETPTNHPQTLKQNTFGGTIGGPIKKDKVFFFGSYQGVRQINGMGTSGFAFGYTPNTNLLPWNDPNNAGDPRHLSGPAFGAGSYRAYLGSVFAGDAGAAFPIPGVSTGVPVAADGSNISSTAIALLQAKGLDNGPYNKGFYFPSAPALCGDVPTTHTGCIVPISEPIRASENQYLINTDYVLSSKHTLTEKYLYGSDPQYQTFNCFINGTMCNPGAPINANYSNHVGQLKLTSVLTSNFVNEARFSFHRDIENNTDPTPVKACSLTSTANIIPMVNNGEACPLTTSGLFAPLAKRFSELNIAPIIDVVGGVSGPWSQGGNFAMISSNFINTFQWADQISWTHGKQTFRAAFEAERIQYNNTIPASGRGELLILSTADFLTSSAGPPGTNPLDPTYDDGTPAAPNGVLAGFGLKGSLTHYNRINAFSSYIQDDIKVSRKLTVNVGLRWEYDGFPDDAKGQFSNVWTTQLAKLNTGSWFLANPTGTLTGFVLPSNYDKSAGLTAPNGATGVLVNSNKTLLPGTPWHNFAPRLGVAWQPLNERFVVRAGYGWFYDRVYGNLLIDNQLNLPPYSGAGSGTAPASYNNSLHNPWLAGAGPLVWTPRYIRCFGPCDDSASSALGYTSDSPALASRLPMVQEYNLDLQYEFARNWVADIGYVGTHSIHLYNYGQNVNIAHLLANAPNNPTAASGPQNTGMIASSLPFNDPGNATLLTANRLACFTCFFASFDPSWFNGNAGLRTSYLGFGPGALATTTTNGDALYNSLQAQLRHQFSHGLLLQVAYTWSKEFTNVNASESGGFLQPSGGVLNGNSNSNNPLDMRQQYGLAAFNRPHRAVISYVYDVPWKHEGGATGRLLSGWSISGVTTIQDGQPFTVVDTAGGSIYGAGFGNASRALLASPINCNPVTGNCHSSVPLATSGSNKQRLSNWLNLAAFTPMCGPGPSCATPLPASSPVCIGGLPNPFGGSGSEPCGTAGATFWGAGTGYGNSAVGSVTGPGQFNWDASISKNTKVWEHGTVQFRAEFYNIWNHAQFNPPGNNVNIPATFGKILSTSNTPRVVQFALKYIF